MSFWDKPKEQAPVAPAGTQRGSAAWWQQEAVPQPQPPQHPLMQQGEQTGEYRPRAKLKDSAGNCPECGSGNYMVTGTAVTQRGRIECTRCYDCGYPVENSTRGMQGVGGNESGHSDGHTRQIAGAGKVVHNYHPEVIVDRAPGKRGPATQG